MTTIKKNFKEFFFIFVLILSIIKLSTQEQCDLLDKKIINKIFQTVKTEDWQDFLSEFQHRISLHDIQADTNKFLQSTLNKEGSTSSEFKVIQEYFDDFLNKLDTIYDFQATKDLSKQVLTKTQLEKLNYILKIFLIDTFSIINCSEQDIIVTGNFISLENALKRFNSQCAGINLNDKRSLQLFAFNTIFIDADINNQLSLVIIAPRWRIIGKRSINLYGRNGNDYKKEQKIIDRLKEIGKMKKIEDGLPGVPGETGGLFFGIGNHFHHDKNLKITSFGGDGGDGDGDNFYDWCVNKTKDQEIEDGKHVEWSVHAQRYAEVNSKYGGRGGARGLGGQPGDLNLIHLGEASNISLIGKHGKNGKKGIGIIEGYGETDKDDNLLCEKYSNGTVTIRNVEPSYFRPAGVSRPKSTTRDDIIEFSYEEGPSDISKLKILNEYQHYFRENFQINMKEFHKMNFMEKLNNNPAVYNFTSSFYANFTSYLIEGLRHLEKESYIQGRDLDLFPFYELLLNKIDLYVTVLESSENLKLEKNEKKLLEYIYATILSRRSKMNENFNDYLITNVPNFLSNLEKDFEKLRHLSDKADKNEFKKAVKDRMEQIKNKLENDIKEKTKAAKEVVDTDLQQEIDDVSKGFKSEMENLKEQINDQKDKTEKERLELEKTKDTVVKHLFAEIVNNVADAMCSALSLAGPEGAVAGALINIPVKISTNIYDRDYNEKLNRVAAIKTSTSSTLTSLKSKLTTMKATKGKRLKANFEEVERITKVEGVPNNVLTTFIGDTKKNTNNLNLEKISWDELTEIEKEFNAKIKEENINLKKGTKGKFEKTLHYLGKLEKLQPVPDLAVGLYSAFTGYSKEMTKIEKTIDDNKKLFDTLSAFETDELPKIVKKLDELVSEVTNIRDKIGTESKIDLDLLALRARNVFFETRRIMEKYLSDFNLKDTLFVVIDKLERILPFLVSSNNVIRDFQEQQNLVNLLIDISESPYEDYDPNKSTMVELEREIISNILLKKYQFAFKAWEQYVFPLSELYLSDIDPPEKFKVRENITDFVYEVETQIKTINEKIIDQNNSIYDGRVIKETLKFTHNNGNADPFFVWKNSEFKSEISQLLSGKEVLLNADIRSELPPLINAIKFNEVKVNFKVNDTERQKDLKDLLDHFKIVLTHFGNNHYTFNNKIYTTNTKQVSVSYYFDSDGDDRPSASDSWHALRDNVGMLSPYVLWSVKLEPEPKRVKTVTWAQLKVFENEVDLELEGRGTSTVLKYKTQTDYPYKSLKACDLPKEIELAARKKRQAVLRKNPRFFF